MVRTTIVMDSSTREKLKKLGAKGDSYEDIVLRLIIYYTSREGNEKDNVWERFNKQKVEEKYNHSLLEENEQDDRRKLSVRSPKSKH